ncbi:hypothetical protein GCM10008090_05480 [Arenicella chitinivorans]|uniref:Uncharacterized protein n=1 Tax=Arenicella chitinivorans TaxID=1329800 RepID=A0A918VIW5_9GAMM|nr:hypothetical protein [Arenicella chitinivorans]GGZ99734.1 hypothetical protein GCM10008090_05480 [Arenicella chitinivorans]
MSRTRCSSLLSVILLVSACSIDEPPDNSTEYPESAPVEHEAIDPAFTSQLEQSLRQSTLSVSSAQDTEHDAMINSDFETRSEQHRVDFIDEVLAESATESEQDAASLAEKFEKLKSIEHAPLDGNADLN